MTTLIPANLFVEFFKPFVRVMFDWARMEEERWPVELSVVSALEQVACWHTPWNFNRLGREVRHDDAEARPIRLAEVEALMPGFGEQRQRYIERMVCEFRQSPPPVQLILPAYELPEGGHILLDGNHRAAALLRARVSFRILLCAVRGPIEESILPELRHW